MNVKNNDIGFVLVKMHNHPIYDQILSTIDLFIKHNPLNQYVVFNSFSDKLNILNVPVLHLNQAKFFYGNLFVFDFVSCMITKNFPNIHKKYLYAQDIPWSSSPSTPNKEWENIIMDPELNIIAKNEHIYDLYNICWKSPIGLSEHFSYDELKNII
jgi:hypothetical protein